MRTNRFAPERFGPDAFSGPTPPPEFVIKANVRSMKFHLPGSANYERMRSELWFRTAEAAVEAGFTRAMR